MRALVQRVKGAAVRVDGHETGRVGQGILVFVGFAKQDNENVLQWMARKLLALRIFEDADGKMNHELGAVSGGVLLVSQFTLYGDCSKGNRPSFGASAAPDVAEQLYDRFVEIVTQSTQAPVESGVFQAHMEVTLVNDGPVTIWLEKEAV